MLQTSTVILAAGHGTRMKSSLPKVLHPVGNRPMLGHVLDVSHSVNPDRVCVVIGDHAPEVGEAAKSFSENAEVFVQSPPQGTGHAVSCAMPGLDGFDGVVFILYADTPLIKSETLEKMAEQVSNGADIAVLGFIPLEPGAYGRLILAADATLDRIIEAKDATSDELEVDLCNSGVMAIRSQILQDQLPKISNDNAKGEYYLTDIVELARTAGSKAVVVEGDEDEVLGVNSRLELAVAEEIFQNRMREQAMVNGVTLLDPQTVYFSADTQIENDVMIGQNVVFGPDVLVHAGAEIKPFSHIEGAVVGPSASIGPYARLRPGTEIGAEAKIGNFVETKKAQIENGAKVSHLSYIGDAQVGEGANIGAGTITCNYDGYHKHQTIIGAGAFVGSNSSLVAPVEIGQGAYVGSGSVITKSVPQDALAVARGRQLTKNDWAVSFRSKMS